MKQEAYESEEWTEVIVPRKGWMDVKLTELWKYRDLILLFVRRDFVSVYKQTILGPLWYLIQPLLTTFIFTLVFGKFAQIPTAGIPPVLFYMSGIVSWNYFAGCLNKTSNTFVVNADIFGKVYFPRLTVPVSIIISTALSLVIQLALLACMYILYSFDVGHIHPNRYLILLPFLILLMALLSLGLGLIISSLTTKYRDLGFLVAFGTQLLMFATPVIYPVSFLADKYKMLLSLNPMTAIIETIRYSMFSVGHMDWQGLLMSAAITFGILTAGIVIFSKVEQNFMDTV
jgi:lipopolysaccharide transport system permease protein